MIVGSTAQIGATSASPRASQATELASGLTAADSAPAIVSPGNVRPRNAHFPHVDSLRALAALSVLVFHVQITGPVYHMATAAPHSVLSLTLNQFAKGVAVFFVISGFVLYRPFVAARYGQSRRPGVATYLRRRFLRIIPAYWLALTVLTLAFSLPDVFTHDWWRYYGLLQIYEHHTSVNGMRVAWTLCIEISFYVILPLYALLADRVARTPVREFALLGAIYLIPTLGFLLIDTHAIGSYPDNTLLGTCDWFALGMALALLSVQGVKIRTRYALLGCAVMFPAMVALQAPFPNHIATGLFAISVVTLAVLTPTPPRLLGWKPLMWLGVVSYGIYLWHATLIPPTIHHVVAANFITVTLGTAAAAMTIAALSYYIVERPIINWGNRRFVARQTPAPAIVVTTAAAADQPAR